jgi:hypothetical protein
VADGVMAEARARLVGAGDLRANAALLYLLDSLGAELNDVQLQALEEALPPPPL